MALLGLQQLPVEIILNIAMQLREEPRDISSLLGSSKVDYLCLTSSFYLDLANLFVIVNKIHFEGPRRAPLSTDSILSLPNAWELYPRLPYTILAYPRLPINTHTIILPPPFYPLPIHLSLGS